MNQYNKKKLIRRINDLKIQLKDMEDKNELKKIALINELLPKYKEIIGKLTPQLLDEFNSEFKSHALSLVLGYSPTHSRKASKIWINNIKKYFENHVTYELDNTPCGIHCNEPEINSCILPPFRRLRDEYFEKFLAIHNIQSVAFKQPLNVFMPSNLKDRIKLLNRIELQLEFVEGDFLDMQEAKEIDKFDIIFKEIDDIPETTIWVELKDC